MAGYGTGRGDGASAVRGTDGQGGRPAASGSGGVRTVVATEILGSSGMLRIDLDGEIYTLRLTRNHRLILTK